MWWIPRFGGSRLPDRHPDYRPGGPVQRACLRASHVGVNIGSPTRRLPNSLRLDLGIRRHGFLCETSAAEDVFRFPFPWWAKAPGWSMSIRARNGRPNAPVPVRIRISATTSIRARYRAVLAVYVARRRGGCAHRVVRRGPSQPSGRSLTDSSSISGKGAATSLVRRVEIANKGPDRSTGLPIWSKAAVGEARRRHRLVHPGESELPVFLHTKRRPRSRRIYALVRISSPEARNSPELVPIVLKRAGSVDPAAPDLPGRTVLSRYRRPAATATPVRANRFQPLQPVPYLASAASEDGQSWLPAAYVRAWLPPSRPASILFR